MLVRWSGGFVSSLIVCDSIVEIGMSGVISVKLRDWWM